MSYQIALPCSNGFTLYADGENLIISSKNQDETIPISQIQSFTLKEQGIAHGTIVFKTVQSATLGVGIGEYGLALGAEKTFFYPKADVDIARQLRDYVADYGKRQSQQTAPEGKVVSVVDEIRGLKGLFDDGILTQDEFEAKKRQLLGI